MEKKKRPEGYLRESPAMQMLGEAHNLAEKIRARIETDEFPVTTDSAFEKAMVRNMSKFNLHVLEFHEEMAEAMIRMESLLNFYKRSFQLASDRIDILEKLILLVADKNLISFDIMDVANGKKSQ